MKLYFKERALNAIAGARPKMTKHGGVIWVKAEIMLNDFPKTVFYDSRFGGCFYFEHFERWYRIRWNDWRMLQDSPGVDSLRLPDDPPKVYTKRFIKRKYPNLF